jgi:hypothetical protein
MPNLFRIVFWHTVLTLELLYNYYRYEFIDEFKLGGKYHAR